MIGRDGDIGDAERLRDGDDDQHHDDDAQRVAEPAGGRTQLAAQQCSQVARVALVHVRRRAAMRGVRVHFSITTTAEAP